MKLKIALFLAAFTLANLTTSAQPKKRDTLQWFVGHWISKTVFKADSNYITGGAINSTITVNKDGSTFVQSPQGQQFNQQIDQGISATDNMETQLKQKLLPEGFNEYHLYTNSMAAMDSVKSYFTALKLPTGPPQPSQNTNSAAINFQVAMARQCGAWQASYNHIIQFWMSHKRIKNEHYDYPPPPQADYFNCWGCNRAAQKAFEQQCKGYDTAFFQPESGMIREALGMIHQLALLGMTDEGNSTSSSDMQNILDNLFRHSKSNPTADGPCAYLNYNDLFAAAAYLTQRMVNKADQLLDDVKKGKNYNSYEPAIRVVLAAHRQAILLLGESNSSENDVLSRCEGLIEDLLNKMVDQAVNQHDVTYLSDVPFMFQLERQVCLLGGKDEGSFLQKMDGLINYTLSLEMNIKVAFKGSTGDVTETAHLKGTANMVLELDTVNCVRIVLSQKEGSVFTFNLLENSVTYPKCSPTYIGTRIYTTPSPELILHLCKNGAIDSLTMGVIAAKPFTAGLWQQPCGPTPPENLGINNLDGFFNDPNMIVKRAQDVKANADAYKQQYANMADQVKQMAAQIMAQMKSGGGTSAGTAANIKALTEMGNTMMTGNVINITRLIIPVTIKNSPAIIDQTVNASQTNSYSQLTALIQYGTLQIQLKSKTQ